MNLNEVLRLSADPIAARRYMESARRRTGGGRRVIARLKPPGIGYREWLRASGLEDMARGDGRGLTGGDEYV